MLKFLIILLLAVVLLSGCAQRPLSGQETPSMSPIITETPQITVTPFPEKNQNITTEDTGLKTEDRKLNETISPSPIPSGPEVEVKFKEATKGLGLTGVTEGNLYIEQTQGPSAGGIKFGLGFSESNPDIIYDDKYKSTDGGNTWTELNIPDQPTNSIEVDPKNPDIVYLATSYRLYKTEDGGVSWKKIKEIGTEDSVISSISINPSDSKSIFVGTTHGLVFMSADSGENWQDITSKIKAESPISRITFNRKKPEEVYISTGLWYLSSLVSRPKTGKGLFKSTDGGKTFSHIESEFGSALVQDVDALGDTVYVTVRYNPDSTDDKEAVYKSSDGGKIWSKLIDSKSHKFDFDLGGITHVALDPKDENHIIISISSWPNENGKEVSFLVSYDGGKTWEESTEKEPIQYTHELEITPEGKVYAQDYYRPFMKSDDGGKTWEWSSQGIRTSRIHSLQIHPTNRNLVFAGTTDGAVHRSFDGGNTWERIGTKLSSTYVASMEFDPEGSGRFYVGVSGPSDTETGRYYGAPGYDTGLYYTEDSGKTLVKIKSLPHPKSEGNQQLEIYDVFVHPKNPKLILVGTASEGIYRSEDGGKTWKESNTGIPKEGFYWNQNFDDEREGSTEKECREKFAKGEETPSACFYYATHTSMSLFLNPHNENEIWYTTLNGIFVSKDLGKTWSWLSDDLKNIHVHFMDFDAKDPNTIYVGTHQGAIKDQKVISSSKGLLISRDGGKTWKQVSDGPGEGKDIRAVAVSPDDPNFVAVGTNGPFYISTDKGVTWKQVELKSVEGVDEIRIDRTAKIIYLGTRNSGVWRGIIDYQSSSPGIVQITGVSYPKTISLGENFEIVVSADNIGSSQASLPIELKIRNVTASYTLTISEADQTAVKFSAKINKKGNYNIIVNGIGYGSIIVL